MEYTVDGRGLSCPQPVLLTVQYMKKNTGSFTIIVDNFAATENVSRTLRKAGRDFELSAEGENTVLTVK